MAKKQIVELIDDIDGSEASQTVRFAYNGTSYQIDLNDKNATKLDKALAPFVAAARKDLPAGGRRAATSGNGHSDYDPGLVRAWAKEHGIEVSSRGRIAASVVEQWRSAT